MQTNLQGQKEDLLLAEESGYITKEHRETFGGGGYIHDPDFGDGVTGVYLPTPKLIHKITQEIHRTIPEKRKV